MSYYEQKIAALEARIEEMANLERMKAVKVEAQLMVRIGELNDENVSLKAEVEQSKRINTELLVLSERQASDIRRLSAELSNITGWGRGLDSDLSKARAELLMVKAEVERLTQRLGGVRLIVTEEMYDELNTKYLEQQHELHNIALTARQILDEKIDLKAQVDRLTKAGDAMLDSWIQNDAVSVDSEAEWYAAKEGKSQP